MHGDTSMLDRLVGALYPLCTLVLIFCLILLTVRNNQRAMRPVTYLAVPGLFGAYHYQYDLQLPTTPQ